MLVSVDIRVTELLCARLCHELASPIGAMFEIFSDNEEGHAISLGGGSDGAGLMLWHPSGMMSWYAPGGMFAQESSIGCGEGGQCVSLGVTYGSVNLILDGPNGQTVLGQTKTKTKAGVETSYPVTTLTFYDKDRNVRRQYP